MSRVARPLEDDPDDLVGACSIGWARRDERTAAPLSATLEEAARVVQNWHPTNLPGSIVCLYEVFSADPFDHFEQDTEPGMHRLAGTNPFPGDPHGTGLDAEAGQPTAALLVEAVNGLRAWLGLTQKQLASYLGISPSTVMSWRREAPKHPRHPRIPTLLSLWASLASARDELGEREVAQLIWARGRFGMAPADDPDLLAERLIAAATEASEAAFLVDDGYVGGGMPMPDVAALTAGEENLSNELRMASGEAVGDDEEGGPAHGQWPPP